ncbi:MAG: DUF881 domain-containing protein [Actinomycetota bacterium]|nr:DUF881 domain-containing protein [Actinomycetota bacterium]
MSTVKDIITAIKSQKYRTQLAISAVCVLLGILIVIQLRAQQSASQALQAATESDLTQIVSNLNNEVSLLKAEANSLRLQLFKIERLSSDSSAVMKESIKNLNNLKIIAGLTGVEGPGVTADIEDKEKAINSYDLVDIITELRVGGAEAISINGIRIVADSGITQDSKGVWIDKKLVTPPYQIVAIGDPEVLYETLAIAGGIKDKLSSLVGVSFNITKESSVVINARSASDR